MEKQEKTMRPIPKNVRQIGERDEEIRLYIEDYVNTFIRKCARADKPIVGALIGDYYRNEGKEFLFVEGAVQAEGYQVTDGRVVMTDEAWSGLYGKISEFFSGRTICGWFICSGESENCNVGMLRGFMYENLGAEKRALIIRNAEAEEETFSVYDQNVIREQLGYYLFYERNEPMQSYMVTTVFAARTDPVAVDAVTTHMRTRMVEKREIPVQKSGYSFVSAAALVLGIIALASGIVMMNHYEQLREMEAMLTNLSGNFLESRNETEEDGTAQTRPVFGELIIEDVSGNVTPTESESEAESAESAGETEPDGIGAGGTLPAEDEGANGESASVSGGNDGDGESQSSENTGQVSGTEAGDETSPAQDETSAAGIDTEAGAVPEYRSYLVEKGDTLVTICWKLYGYRDDEIIDRICEINQLADKDHIYAGQELLIP
ncbi:MAG: LysM peptidoglycan-binding domain-containing protein [Lachnospiraceae bacterium]|nr:LysM peptidoglycan-binding domain-containing protein [Lachnospiraceae bacterium]